jgi:hypothetical protein
MTPHVKGLVLLLLAVPAPSQVTFVQRTSCAFLQQVHAVAQVDTSDGCDRLGANDCGCRTGRGLCRCRAFDANLLSMVGMAPSVSIRGKFVEMDCRAGMRDGLSA